MSLSLKNQQLIPRNLQNSPMQNSYNQHLGTLKKELDTPSGSIQRKRSKKAKYKDFGRKAKKK